MPGTTPDGLVGKVVGLLSLLAVMPVFALSLPLSFVFGTPSVWQFGEKYRPSFSYVWSRFMTEGVMGCHLKLVGSRGLYKDGPCVYLANHRAWSDFFIDMYLTEGRAFILSRYLVVYVFPLFAAPAMFIGAVFAFKRNKPGQHEALNANLDAHLAAYPDFKGMVVYPEGTRNVRPDALPLRRGLIKYAWSRGLDVQVIIASDKEHVLSSHLYSASWGVEILCGYGEVVSSKAHPNDFEAFFAEVKRSWDAEWDRVYGAKHARGTSRAPALKPHAPKVQLVEYTAGATGLLIGYTLACVLVAILVVAAVAKRALA
jgi:1-acyl-sn-glycerol-3-phosphate acyltransferase